MRRVLLVAALAAATLTVGTTQSANAEELAGQLGARSAGSYLDDGKLVVTVTDEAAARSVRGAGAIPRFVVRSGAVLEAATEQLGREATVPGTSWATDPVTNQVVVQADSTVTGTKRAQLEAAVAKLGGAARIEHVPGTFTTLITGGDAIFGGGFRCSLGFNVQRPGVSGGYFLTAGHCGNAAASWSASGGR